MERKYITPDIIDVRAIEEYKLYIEFSSGEKKIFDMMPLLEHKFYKGLKDKERFKKVKPNGITVEWETGEDVAPESLYYDSVSDCSK